MPKPTFLKLALIVVVILTVAGVGYTAFIIWQGEAMVELPLSEPPLNDETTGNPDVTIVTDQGAYYRDEIPIVTVYNDSPSPIYTGEYLVLEWQKNEGGWHSLRTTSKRGCTVIPRDGGSNGINKPLTFNYAPATSFFPPGVYRLVLHYWEDPSCRGGAETVASTVFVLKDRYETFVTLCQGKKLVPEDVIDLNFDQDGDSEALIVCGDLTQSKSGLRYIFVLDGRDADSPILWKQGLDGESSNPEITDINRDGVNEIFWTNSRCGGTCTGCSSSRNLYSSIHNEIFSITDSSWLDEACTNVTHQTKTSPNLKEVKYALFKEYLEGRAAYSPL